jgi:O-antigen/teichoic acid export membrane protein
MEQLARTIRTSTFVRHNAIFFIGSLSIGLLNYLYYPVLGRLLHPNNFGEVQVLFSLFAQIAIFLNVLGLITVNVVVNDKDVPRRNRIILELEKLALLIGGVLLLVTIISAAALQRFFHFGAAAPFVILMLAVVVTVPLAFRSAFLRGMQHFGLAAAIGIIGAAGDLLVSVIFVLAGWHTTGAIAALVVAQLIAFSCATRYARKSGFTESLHGNLFRLPDFRLILPELKYALLVLVSSLAITALYSIDTVAVKHYFDAHTAGLYAGISTIARVIFFLTASIVGVLLPSIRLQQSAHDNQLVLLKSFALLGSIGGLALIVFTLLPNFIVRLLMGKTYLPYADLLPRLSLVLFIVSILNLFIMYHVALRRYGVISVVLLGIAATMSLLWMNHQTLRAVINRLLYGSLTMLVLLGGWVGLVRSNTLAREEVLEG